MRYLTSISTGILTSIFWVQYVCAQVYSGDGVIQGTVDAKDSISDISGEEDLYELIKRAIEFTLFFVTIIAVGAIIIGGIYLITSNGDDEQKDKAKKIILYVIIGLILIMLAVVIVGAAISFTNDVATLQNLLPWFMKNIS